MGEVKWLCRDSQAVRYWAMSSMIDCLSCWPEVCCALLLLLLLLLLRSLLLLLLLLSAVSSSSLVLEALKPTHTTCMYNMYLLFAPSLSVVNSIVPLPLAMKHRPRGLSLPASPRSFSVAELRNACRHTCLPRLGEKIGSYATRSRLTPPPTLLCTPHTARTHLPQILVRHETCEA